MKFLGYVLPLAEVYAFRVLLLLKNMVIYVILLHTHCLDFLAIAVHWF